MSAWSAWFEVQAVRGLWAWRVRQGRLNGEAIALDAAGAAAGPLPGSPRRILVLRLDEIGDAVLGLPFLNALRRRWPDAEIRVLCKPSLAPLYSAFPAVDEAIPYGLLKGKNRSGAGGREAALEFARDRLAPWRPDLCVNPRWGSDLTGAAFLALGCGSPCRVAWSERVSPLKARLNPGFDKAYTLVLGPGRSLHQAELGLEMAKALGAGAAASAGAGKKAGGAAGRAAGRNAVENAGPRPPAADRRWAEAAVGAGPWLVLAPGASHPKKRWPADRFAVLARHAAESRGLKPLVLGAAEDGPLGEAILAATGIGGLNLCGQATLPRSLAVLGLARCRAFAGNDSGVAHMAAAMGTPCLVVSGYAQDADPAGENAPGRFHPWGVPYELARPRTRRRPCVDGCEAYSAHCILQVEAREAMDALDRLLAGGAGKAKKGSSRRHSGLPARPRRAGAASQGRSPHP